ncbi:MAG: Uncharacterised protein [Hyphomonas sp. TMED17]|nr:MAG: Uncharacterised protein [Hyphomonas sp. TMED17]
MAGDIGHDLAIEKTAALGPATTKYNVHGRRNPDHSDTLCEVICGCSRAVYADCALWCPACLVETDADLMVVIKYSRYGPAALGALPDEFVKRCRAQAAPRPEQTQGFEYVGFARPILAKQTDCGAFDVQGKRRMIAEIRESKF